MRATGAGLLLIGLSIVSTGAAASVAPAWSPPAPAPTLSARPGVTPPPQPHGSYVAEELAIPTARGARPGTLLLPTAPGRHPGVVMVPGSGEGHRAQLLAGAKELAARGVATVVYDKNLSGYTPLARDYDALGADALDALRLLRGRPEVAAEHAGLWGFSEGGWVTASAAARDPGVAFVVMVSAPTVSPGEQAAWMASRLLHQHRLDLLQHPVGLHLTLGRPFLRYTDYHPPLSRVHQPVLAMFGAEDLTVPVGTAVSRLRAELPRPPTVHVFADSGHALTTPAVAQPHRSVDATAQWIMRRGGEDNIEVPVSQGVAVPETPRTDTITTTLLYAAAALGVAGITTILALVARSVQRAGRRQWVRSRQHAHSLDGPAGRGQPLSRSSS